MSKGQALQEKQKLLARAMKAIGAAEKALDSGKTATPAILKRLIEVINMQSDVEAMKKYYSEEAQKVLNDRRKLWSPELQEQVSKEWMTLFDDIKSAIAQGVQPESKDGQALAETQVLHRDDVTPAIQGRLRSRDTSGHPDPTESP